MSFNFLVGGGMVRGTPFVGVPRGGVPLISYWITSERRGETSTIRLGS